MDAKVSMVFNSRWRQHEQQLSCFGQPYNTAKDCGRLSKKTRETLSSGIMSQMILGLDIWWTDLKRLKGAESEWPVAAIECWIDIPDMKGSSKVVCAHMTVSELEFDIFDKQKEFGPKTKPILGFERDEEQTQKVALYSSEGLVYRTELGKGKWKFVIAMAASRAVTPALLEEVNRAGSAQLSAAQQMEYDTNTGNSRMIGDRTRGKFAALGLAFG
ncbi:hypothetical protein KM043_017087 [Ampulex compressa]|nr:hypothetical protein KM043_017087 [Ampulex compressa]